MMSIEQHDDSRSDSEYEYFEEDVTVIAVFPDIADTNIIHKANKIVIGDVFTAAPTCDIDGYKFVGNVEQCLGSRLILNSKKFEMSNVNEDTSNESSFGAHLSSNTLAMTDKCITFNLQKIPKSHSKS